MKKLIRYSFLILLGLLTVSTIHGQTKEELENKKTRLQKEIKYNSKLLKETQKSQRLSSIQVVMLNKRIASRQRLISTIRSEARLLDRQISENNILMESMKNDLDQLKKEYAKMIYYAYKNRSAYDRLMFIFSSSDFSQAYRRTKYYQQYSNYRKTQVKLIIKTQEVISDKLEELKQRKIEKEKLLGIERSEKKNLSVEKTEQQTTLRKLENKESELKKDIKKKQAESKRLQEEIETMIEELQKKGKNFIPLTPEEKLLSTGFAGNKGKLPWPVLKGVITSYFGEQDHPVLKQVKVKNNGIDINTTKGAIARAVFEGRVTGIVAIPGSGKAVMIRHGDYYTVYSNLQEVFIAKGDMVELKSTIGKILTDSSTGKTELHFELWKRKAIMNPSQWLSRSR